MAVLSCSECGKEAVFSPSCGAHVCEVCGRHQGLVRCYCGWAVSGGDGRQELEEMGETIDPEPGYAEGYVGYWSYMDWE